MEDIIRATPDEPWLVILSLQSLTRSYIERFRYLDFRHYQDVPN